MEATWWNKKRRYLVQTHSSLACFSQVGFLISVNGCLNKFIGQLKLDCKLEFYFECRDRYWRSNNLIYLYSAFNASTSLCRVALAISVFWIPCPILTNLDNKTTLLILNLKALMKATSLICHNVTNWPRFEYQSWPNFLKSFP